MTFGGMAGDSAVSNLIGIDRVALNSKTAAMLPWLSASIFLQDIGADYWIFNNTLNSIIQIKNTSDFSYFVSKQKYDRFDITFKCTSYNYDDDMNGFIFGYRNVGDKIYLLGASRSPNKNSMEAMKHWYIFQDVAMGTLD